MCNTAKGRRHWNYFDKCNRMVCNQTVTFVAVLNACARMVALEEGRHAHEQIIQSGLELDVFVRKSLVDMYAKCGSMEDAWIVFNKMPSLNVVTWTAILGGCACAW
jgi:pentatricopeptide repeat protein